MTVSDEERADRYLRRNPDASVAELAGSLGIAPDEARGFLEGAPIDDGEGADEAREPRGKTAEESKDADQSAGETDDAPPTPSEHYARLGDLYATLGTLDGALLPANADKTSWYYTEPAGDGFDGRGRPLTLSADFGEIVDDIDRTLYVAVNYAPDDYYLDAWGRYEWTDPDDPDDTPTREWESGSNPMPDYGDLAAIAPFADVDLLDDVKADRADGDIPQETIERALDGYIEGFADLCGGRGPVFALDSVGGAYVIVAPSVTAPIAERFDRADRATILEKLCSRVNDHLADVRDRVHGEIDGLDDVLDPDMVTHKNRIHKAPLSLHADIDGVVTPLDTDAPDYSLTPPEAVDADLIADAEAWADAYTADYSDRVSELVATLWPDYADGQAWDDALREWLDDRRRDPEPDNAGGNSGTSSGSDTPDYADTAPLDDVYRALDDIDATDVADETIVSSWNDDATSGKGQGFYPTWGPNSNGTANYATEKIWHDTGSGDYGTVVEMALIGASGVNWTRGEIAEGADWVQGIKELRKLGYDVPLPEGDGLPENASPYYSLDLEGIADDHGVSGDPYDDDMALLKTCLAARDDIPDLADETPPYAALVAVAEWADLSMSDPDDGILGETAHRYAREIYAELSRDDLNTAPAAEH